MKRVLVVYGTRPEAIKVAPLIMELRSSSVLEPVVVSTGQHRELLDSVNRWFQIRPDFDLSVYQQGQSLNELSARILDRLPAVLGQVKPAAAVVQGDTTTVAMAAMACFYSQVPVVHLEAGLRSGNLNSPFPEEANRKVVSQVSALHLAPTPAARDNLLREAVPPETIVVTGNTVIDALKWTSDRRVSFTDPTLAREAATGRTMVLLTTHRRENWGAPMTEIGQALAELARRYPRHLFVFPAHANPMIRAAIAPAVEDLPNVLVTPPMDYPEFIHAQRWAELVLTDSGGVQEEAPSLGKPVLVLRDNTERPEAVAAGTVKLIGTARDRIVAEASELLDDANAYARMSHAVNPYGDGRAAVRSAAAIASLLGVGSRLPDFEPARHA